MEAFNLLPLDEDGNDADLRLPADGRCIPIIRNEAGYRAAMKTAAAMPEAPADMDYSPPLLDIYTD